MRKMSNKYSCLLFLFLIIGGTNVEAQKITSFKPKKDLVKTIDLVLSQSCKQYQILIKAGIDTLLPRTYENGKVVKVTSPNWVSGFYPGTLFFLYRYSKNKIFYEEAIQKLKVLEKEKNNTTTHDLGFMMFCSFGNAEHINKDLKNEILLTAQVHYHAASTPK